MKNFCSGFQAQAQHQEFYLWCKTATGKTMLEQRRASQMKRLEMCCGIMLNWSCSPSPLSTLILHLSVLFFFRAAKSGWQEAGWSSVRAHAIYDLARWTQTGPNLQMIWFCVCPDPHWMLRSVPGHAVWINYTLLKVAQQYLTRAFGRDGSEHCRCVFGLV